jgi:DNA replication and repair protein RecF
MFKKFQIDYFRNIRHCSLHLSDGINFIIGDNGAGKTSILEAINYIARAQSFRTKNISHIINHQSTYFQLLATQETGATLGMRRTPTEIIARLNRLPIKKLSTLAKSIPLFLITPNTHELIERGPEYRRRFIDWGLFHVEPGYGKIIQEYRRVLKQRNAALRISSSQSVAWDPGLIKCAEKVDVLRKAYVKKVTPIFVDIYGKLTGSSEITLDYQSGWKSGSQFSEQLHEKQVIDNERGFTSIGPHRADVNIKVSGIAAREVLSRGQQKMAVIALVIAQARLASEDYIPILLIDDLSSELDIEHQSKLFQLIKESHNQTFITSVNPSILEMVKVYSLFHVEHGVVSMK